MNIEQILGLITGIAFGFILQRARVLRYEKQIGAMLLQDMTIFKIYVVVHFSWYGWDSYFYRIWELLHCLINL
jgi:hypothetical protein